MSKGVLTNKNMKILKENNFAKIYNGKQLIACGIRETNNLYTMLFKTMTQDTTAVMEVSNSLRK